MYLLHEAFLFYMQVTMAKEKLVRAVTIKIIDRKFMKILADSGFVF